MKRLILLIMLLILGSSSALVCADDELGYIQFYRKFDAAKLQPKHMDFVKASMRSLIANEWIVMSVEKNRVVGKHEDGALVEFLLASGSIVTIREIPKAETFSENWLDDLMHRMLGELKYLFFVDYAKDL